jgi:hypothetical protein
MKTKILSAIALASLASGCTQELPVMSMYKARYGNQAYSVSEQGGRRICVTFTDDDIQGECHFSRSHGEYYLDAATINGETVEVEHRCDVVEDKLQRRYNSTSSTVEAAELADAARKCDTFKRQLILCVGHGLPTITTYPEDYKFEMYSPTK